MVGALRSEKVCTVRRNEMSRKTKTTEADFEADSKAKLEVINAAEGEAE
jgi:hypothetical protein